MPAEFIALDWGTTSFRAYLVGQDGAVREECTSPDGILSVKGGSFEHVLESAIAGWDRSLPVLASGMITSRQGWVEVAYVPAPAGLAELAAGVKMFRTGAGRNVLFVPGVSMQAGNTVPEVMRGEETQIVGALSESNGLFVMRGTHCKWVRVESQRIVRFATFMTGELFAILKTHSILGRLMADESASGRGFDRGVTVGLASDAKGGGLLHDLFGVRTLGLFDDLVSDQLAPYLSGLLIGSEIAGAKRMFEIDADGVTVIGAPTLADPFRQALTLAGIPSRPAIADPAVRGLAKIGRKVGAIV